MEARLFPKHHSRTTAMEKEIIVRPVPISDALLVIDSALDDSLYARGHVRKEIVSRNRLDLVYGHAIRSPITINRSGIRYYHRNRSRRRCHSRNVVTANRQDYDHLPRLRGHRDVTVRNEVLQSLAAGNDVKLIAL